MRHRSSPPSCPSPCRREWHWQRQRDENHGAHRGIHVQEDVGHRGRIRRDRPHSSFRGSRGRARDHLGQIRDRGSHRRGPTDQNGILHSDVLGNHEKVDLADRDRLSRGRRLVLPSIINLTHNTKRKKIKVFPTRYNFVCSTANYKVGRNYKVYCFILVTGSYFFRSLTTLQPLADGNHRSSVWGTKLSKARYRAKFDFVYFNDNSIDKYNAYNWVRGKALEILHYIA